MTYSIPTKAITDALNGPGQIEKMARSGAFEDFDLDLITPILEEAGKLASEIIQPTNAVGHQQGAQFTENGVEVPKEFKAAYDAFREGGWTALSAPTEYGGQGLPHLLGVTVMEMIQSSNISFCLCPMLTLGAIDAIYAHGTEAQKRLYLPKMISGEWTGAMALTEAQAGSDVGALKTKAVPNSDGSYAISGQKIYITWGDHNLTENIIHLVLARLPDAPDGPKGISLFALSKFNLDDDGQLKDRNSFKCIGLEQKMGIHASPTCVMEYDNATGYLIGEPNNGLAAMFTMMNDARLQVGVQGIGASEAAFQVARAYAADRVQFGKSIDRMPDVQRNLARARAITQAARSIAYATASAGDFAKHSDNDAAGAAAKARQDLLTPIAKAWCTDRGVEITSLAVQVHGGMGFMNETLACQLYQDVRIAPIYEGTNGIQANDLVGRKVARDGGEAMAAMIAEIRETVDAARACELPGMGNIAEALAGGVKTLSEATQWVLDTSAIDASKVEAGASAYLALAGNVIGGHFLTQIAVNTKDPENIALAGFYAQDVLAPSLASLSTIVNAAEELSVNAELLIGTV